MSFQSQFIHEGRATSNDSQAINNATAFASSFSGGGIVYFPPGNYRIQTSILVYNNTELLGANVGNTQITALSGLVNADNVITANMITNVLNSVGPPSSRQQNISVRNLTLNGNALAQDGAFSGSEYPGKGASIAFALVEGVLVEGCRIVNCPNHALTVDGGAEGSTFPGNIRLLDNTIDIMAVRSSGELTQGNINIRVQAFQNVLIRGNVIGYNPDLALVPGWVTTWSNDGIDTPSCSDVTITGNMATLVVDGIDVAGGVSCTIADNIVENFIGYGIRSFDGNSTGGAVNQLVITNNAITAWPWVSGSQIPSLAGIHADNGSNSTAVSYAISNNAVIGPFGGACIIAGASQGSCVGNSIDVRHSQASSVAQIGLLIRGNNVTAAANQIFDSIMPNASYPTIGIQFLVATVLGSLQLDITLNGNVAKHCITGIDIENSLTNCTLTENNVADATNGLTMASGITLTGVRIAGNLGINPVGSVGPPTFPSSGTAEANPYPYDCMVYIHGGTAVSVTVDSAATGLGSGVGYFVAATGSIKVTYGAGAPPVWVWVAN